MKTESKSARKSSLTEIIKTLVILLLLAGAVVLGRQSGLLNDFFDSVRILGGNSGTENDISEDFYPGGTVSAPAALPSAIVITDLSGERYGAKYDNTELRQLYDEISSILAEALGSATEPRKTELREMEDAVDSGSIFIEYAMPVQLQVLDGWYGARVSGEFEDVLLRSLYIAFDGDETRLYYRNLSDGACYSAHCESVGAKLRVLGGRQGNGVQFAFELPNLSDDNPFFPVFPNAPHPVVTRVNPLTDATARTLILSLFGISIHINSGYTESDGTVIYVTDTVTVRISPDGTVRFHGSGVYENPDLDSEGKAVDLARYAVSDTIGRYCGEALLNFTGIAYETVSDAVIITFEYFTCGGEIGLPGEEPAAIIRIENGAVTSMTLRFRRYTIATDSVLLLPEQQAYAASGGAFTLFYPDDGGNEIVPVWIRRPIGETPK